MARKHRRGDGRHEGRAPGEGAVEVEHEGDGVSRGEEIKASGAPEAGGATSRGSLFGGLGLQSRLLRALARFGRAIEAGAYRRLRDLDRFAPEPSGARGRPNRVREAATHNERDTPHPVQ